MAKTSKILIAGVGGQGVVYLTNILVEAALLAGIPVSTSEIHGLSQRGGSVMAGITFGKDAYGFLEKAGVDFLIGLEPLEAQRCLPYLHRKSKVLIDNNRILPYSVNAQQADYPDTEKFIKFLRKRIEEIDFIAEVNKDTDFVVRNIFVLGRATLLGGFPLNEKYIREAILNFSRAKFAEKSINAFQLGRKYEKKEVSNYE